MDDIDPVACPFCDEHQTFNYRANEKFAYGDGAEATALTALVEVTECRSCGLASTGEDAEDSRNNAVRAYFEQLIGKG